MTNHTPSPVIGRGRRERLKIALLRALIHVAPTGGHAVVAGAPDDEGNSVEIVRALAPHRKVYWLVNDDPQTLEWMVSDAVSPEDLHFVPKDSLRAFAAYVTARHVFFTHGLYGSPAPPRRKTVVNLWHGDGPKRRKGFAEIRATYVVSGTEKWGRPKAAEFHVEDRAVLLTGNPRIDQFARPASDQVLAALGLDASRPLVLWLPTYRTTGTSHRRLGAVRNWSDGATLSGTGSVRELLDKVADAASRRGVTLAVKPHPLDGDQFGGTGIVCLTGGDLRDARVTLYQLLGRASGLLTDYSSVWTDFLARDRPIGFYCPDLDEYVATRGLNVVGYPSILPGPLLHSPADFERFLEACSADQDPTREMRRQSISLLGAEIRLGATDRLLRVLDILPGAATATPRRSER